MGIWDDIKNTFRHGSSLTRLIYINIAVFILITISAVVGFLMNNPETSDKILNLFSVPSSLKALILRPWTIITYMFVHKDILAYSVQYAMAVLVWHYLPGIPGSEKACGCLSSWRDKRLNSLYTFL